MDRLVRLAQTPPWAAIAYLVLPHTAVPRTLDWLSPREQSTFRGLHLAKRQRDWLLGRWTAKQALLGRILARGERAAPGDLEIIPAPSGAPEAFWRGAPTPWTVSLSHSGGLGLCMLGPRRVEFGCDLEQLQHPDAALVRDYFTAHEQTDLAAAPPALQDTQTILVWSAKESVLKALREGLRLDTHEVEISLELAMPSDSGWHPFAAAHLPTGRRFVGRWRPLGAYVATVAMAHMH